MSYLIGFHWAWLLLALILGVVIGWVTYLRPRSRWMDGLVWIVAAMVALAAIVAISTVIPGRPGYWLEMAVLMVLAYVIGCPIGWALRHQAFRNPASAADHDSLLPKPGYVFPGGTLGGGEPIPAAIVMPAATTEVVSPTLVSTPVPAPAAAAPEPQTVGFQAVEPPSVARPAVEPLAVQPLAVAPPTVAPSAVAPLVVAPVVVAPRAVAPPAVEPPAASPIVDAPVTAAVPPVPAAAAPPDPTPAPPTPPRTEEASPATSAPAPELTPAVPKGISVVVASSLSEPPPATETAEPMPIPAAPPPPSPSAPSPPAPSPPAPSPSAPVVPATPVEIMPLPLAATTASAGATPQKAPPVPDEGRHAGVRPDGFVTARDNKADDLKRIKGIGPQNEGRLHGLGIWHFDQIGAWTPDNVKWVGSYLAFHGRIDREKWIDQARELAIGQDTAFSKRVAAGDVATSRDDGSLGQENVDGSIKPRKR